MMALQSFELLVTSCPRILLWLFHPEEKGAMIFKMLGSDCSVKQHHIPGNLNLLSSSSSIHIFSSQLSPENPTNLLLYLPSKRFPRAYNTSVGTHCLLHPSYMLGSSQLLDFIILIIPCDVFRLQYFFLSDTQHVFITPGLWWKHSLTTDKRYIYINCDSLFPHFSPDLTVHSVGDAGVENPCAIISV
jgi:hypothetical protein